MRKKTKILLSSYLAVLVIALGLYAWAGQWGLGWYRRTAQESASLAYEETVRAVQTLSAVLETVIPRFEALESWDDEHILDCMVKLAEEQGVKNSKIMWPVRIAAAGKAVTPGGAVEICRILGREETLRRLQIGLEKLQ